MSDSFWSQLFSNAPAIIGALFAGIAMVVSLFNGRKIKDVKQDVEAGAVQRAAQTESIKQVGNAIAENKKATLLAMDEKHRDFVQVLGTSGLFDQQLIAQQISDFGKLK